ncbi:MAG TPA: hypothetical protein VFZ34_15180 [Blastocatellia bacterium]|nr:hypothetical protein [Blastocatellia bacterium]
MNLHKSFLLATFAFVVALCGTAATIAQPKPAPATPLPEKLPVAEFTRLIREFSEDGGEFHSDNLISNETSYLHISDKLKELGATGGAYIGVGPEQNFTYIAKTRPRLAFIIDLRRLAVVQHLMYKAMFQLSPTRAEFLSHLLSVPLVKGKAPAANAPINDLVAYFTTTPADEKLYAANLTELRKMIQKDFQFAFTEQENQGLEYVLSSFKTDGLSISYQLKNGFRGMYFPTLKEIITQTDLNGKQGGFLASDDDYNYVRNLHLKNLIVPITGNFAGTKAFPAVADYLRKHGLVVNTIYCSNVEQYLFEYQVFDGFAANVKKLPTSDQSLFIRTLSSRGRHPARVNGHMFTTLMQRVSVFLKDFNAGEYTYYQKLVNMNYIAPEQK